MPAGSIRARVRAEMIAEIKTIARRHLETDGANLSLRAVARDMGMVSSALYRYFASRDDLLTALILDAYNALGEAAEAADAAVTDRSQLRARWLATARGIRGWALRTPAEYALLFGTPVPGYAAPADTITAAARTPVVLIRILADGFASGALSGESALRIGVPAGGPGALAASSPASPARRPQAAGIAARLADAVRADLSRARGDIAPELPDELMLAGITGWVQLFGMVSFELSGQFNNVIEARAEFFGLQMEVMADLIGL
ncbi:MAG TPA: TetR-like C-terminal domain-containing protein [Streptosporangiaceae bacterium]|nr:TetR-like C-terminal domain-containing protein [Streptosporangiaceae bacterium]